MLQIAPILLRRVPNHCLRARRFGRGEDIQGVNVAGVGRVVAGDEGDVVVLDGELVRGIGEQCLAGNARGLSGGVVSSSSYGVLCM